MTATEEMLRRNATRAGSGPGKLPARPALRTAVLTCMDARIDVFALLGLRPGEAHVLRNAGGVVTDDVIRSLAISQRKLGTTEILVLHHTGCGMATFTDEDLAFELHEATGLRPPWQVRTFRDISQDVHRSVQRLRRSPFVRHEGGVRGFVMDIESGELEEVGSSTP
ncbi:MAG: beta-class carbonic anhydrase [Pseudonocardiaceae bacterium]